MGGVTPSSLKLFRPAPVLLGHGLLPPSLRAGWLQVWVLVLDAVGQGLPEVEARLPPVLMLPACETLDSNENYGLFNVCSSQSNTFNMHTM